MRRVPEQDRAAPPQSCQARAQEPAPAVPPRAQEALVPAPDRAAQPQACQEQAQEPDRAGLVHARAASASGQAAASRALCVTRNCIPAAKVRSRLLEYSFAEPGRHTLMG